MSENTLKRAAQILSGACDGARSIDGSGFNKFDTAKGLRLASLPDGEWNEVVNAQAYTLLAKYRKQLQKAGFDFAQVAKPDLTLGKVNTEFVTAEGGNFHVFFKDFKVLDAVRALPRREFKSNLTPKRWVVPATVEAVEAIAAMAEKSGFEIRESALDLMSEVYSEEETEAQVKHADSVIESVETHSKRAQAFVSLAKSVNCKSVIPMTGTPMKNGQPINMYPLLLAVGAEVAEDKAYYQKRYCAGGVDRWGRYSVTGASHLDELHRNHAHSGKRCDSGRSPLDTRRHRARRRSSTSDRSQEHSQLSMVTVWENR